MNIGDKVRMMRSREEGVITKFIDNNTIEIAIDGDFRIPVLRKEIVVIAREESSFVALAGTDPKKPGKQAPAIAPKEAPIAEKGFYMAFVPVNDRVLSLHIINNTDLDVPFTLGEERQQTYKGLYTGVLPKRSKLLSEEVVMSEFDKWPTFVLQLLFHKQGVHPLKAPMIRKLRFRANTFFKTLQKAPVINKEAYLFQIDNEHAVEMTPDEIVQKIAENKPAGQPITEKVAPPPKELDLHIEKLVADHTGMSNREMLRTQLEAFEKALDSAIATGMDEITFIHGVGNGVLRQELHKQLSRHNEVAFFQDARKEKFGYGATLVKLK
jgi:hypothetical protein